MAYQEREAKFYVNHLSVIADRLIMTGADLTRARILERNFRLDTPAQTLESESRILRIREDDRVRVTYKDNARLEEGVVSRTEIEVTTDSLAITRKLFEALGYQVTVIYEKYRRVYRLGDVEVDLDELPYGDFVEVEAPSAAMIEGVAQMLGLNWGRRVETNYLGLMARLKEKRSLPFDDLTFANFQSLNVTGEDLGVQPADG